MPDLSNTVPPPSPEAAQTIVEVIELLEKGERERALRLLVGCFNIVSPMMLSWNQLQFLNHAIEAGKQDVTLRDPMEFDRFHYADAAIRLNLVDEIEDPEMQETIEAVHASEPSVEPSIELTARYAKFLRAHASKR